MGKTCMSREHMAWGSIETQEKHPMISTGKHVTYVIWQPGMADTGLM